MGKGLEKFLNGVQRSAIASENLSNAKGSQSSHLVGLIEGARISGKLKGDSVPREVVSFGSPEKVIQYVKDLISDREIINFETVSVQITLLSFDPIYMADYSVDSLFRTSALHHNVHENGVLTIDVDGNQIRSKEVDLIRDQLGKPHSKHKLSNIAIESPEHRLSLIRLEKIFQTFAQMVHTENVSYYGGNNVQYRKLCIPPLHDIAVMNIREFFLPYWKLNIRINGTTYPAVILEINENYTIIEDASAKCSIGSCDASEKGFCCRDCSKIVCRKHVKSCKGCRDPVCYKCAHIVPRFIVIKDYYCKKCFNGLSTAVKTKSKKEDMDSFFKKLNWTDYVGGFILLSSLAALVQGRVISALSLLLLACLTSNILYQRLIFQRIELTPRKRVILAIIALLFVRL